MSKPYLLVVAGCNGSGKSTFSKVLTNGDVLPFDYDFHFLQYYNQLPDSELREKIAHHKAFAHLIDSINDRINKKMSFCYETNFNSTPMHWPNLFKENGYDVNMIYFCLDSISEAKRRVQIRFQNGGHFVPDHEVEERFKLGYMHLNQFYKEFNRIDLFDASKYDAAPEHVLSLANGKIEIVSDLPKYLSVLIPDIFNITKI